MQSKILPLTQPYADNQLADTLSEQVVFHSPVRDYRGRADVAHILMTIGSVLSEIEAQRELVAERRIVTLITATHRDHRMTGVLDETFDAHGRIERATLLLNHCPRCSAPSARCAPRLSDRHSQARSPPAPHEHTCRSWRLRWSSKSLRGVVPLTDSAGHDRGLTVSHHSDPEAPSVTCEAFCSPR